MTRIPLSDRSVLPSSCTFLDDAENRISTQRDDAQAAYRLWLNLGEFRLTGLRRDRAHRILGRGLTQLLHKCHQAVARPQLRIEMSQHAAVEGLLLDRTIDHD